MLRISDNSEFQPLLEKVVLSPALETLWIDLLAQLEYVGCRKILKSLPFQAVDSSVLQHVSEEALHAFLLKQLVDKRGRKDHWGGNPFSQAGWEYFQNLDQRVSAEVETAYPAVSWIIEQRVLSVYPLYRDFTKDLSVKRVIQRILAQETRHEALFRKEPFTEKQKSRMFEIEGSCWSEFLGRFRQDLRAVESFQERLEDRSEHFIADASGVSNI